LTAATPILPVEPPLDQQDMTRLTDRWDRAQAALRDRLIAAIGVVPVDLARCSAIRLAIDPADATPGALIALLPFVGTAGPQGVLAHAAGPPSQVSVFDGDGTPLAADIAVSSAVLNDLAMLWRDQVRACVAAMRDLVDRGLDWARALDPASAQREVCLHDLHLLSVEIDLVAVACADVLVETRVLQDGAGLLAGRLRQTIATAAGLDDDSRALADRIAAHCGQTWLLPANTPTVG